MKSPTTTLTPNRKSSRTVAKPSPETPPVTIATEFESNFIFNIIDQEQELKWFYCLYYKMYNFFIVLFNMESGHQLWVSVSMLR